MYREVIRIPDSECKHLAQCLGHSRCSVKGSCRHSLLAAAEERKGQVGRERLKMALEALMVKGGKIDPKGAGNRIISLNER